MKHKVPPPPMKWYEKAIFLIPIATIILYIMGMCHLTTSN